MKSVISNKKRLKITLIIVFAVLLAAVIGCAIYLGSYYRADTDAINKMDFGGSFTIKELDNGSIAYIPESSVAGVIFYPGGKVEHTAYAPLMKALASEGIASVLVKMPFNLAVFDIDAAEGIKEEYPEIQSWYLAGHSLGGSMAASYLADSYEEFDGLILLGSYSTADISALPLKVLSIYGSEDKVLNREKYGECLANLPEDTYEFVIEGGCHAYFGVYGAQKGDGAPSITNKEQILITSEKIKEFIGG